MRAEVLPNQASFVMVTKKSAPFLTNLLAEVGKMISKQMGTQISLGKGRSLNHFSRFEIPFLPKDPSGRISRGHIPPWEPGGFCHFDDLLGREAR
jgi:hypothetical protein